MSFGVDDGSPRLASTPDGHTECFGGAKLLGYVQATDN